MDALIDQSGNDRRQSRGLSTSLFPPLLSEFRIKTEIPLALERFPRNRSRGRSSGAGGKTSRTVVESGSTTVGRGGALKSF